MIVIHQSGEGADKFIVRSYHNGLSLNFEFGAAGSPMRNVFLQGEDASRIREEFDEQEKTFPDKESRQVWLDLIDPYL